MYVTRKSRSVLSAVSRNRGSSWNVLPVDTGALLYSHPSMCFVLEILGFREDSELMHICLVNLDFVLCSNSDCFIITSGNRFIPLRIHWAEVQSCCVRVC
jgi:hypothetical protein